MTTSELFETIKTSYLSFTDYIDNLTEEQFLFTDGKSWSAGQQLEHIVKSIVPLNTYMSLPNFTKKLIFGKNKSNSRSYNELVNSYQSKLKAGGKSPIKFEPKIVLFSEKETLISKLNYNLNKFIKSLEKFSEKDLDSFRIPHPLIGKISIREMLYFSDYHVLHHLKSIQNKLNQ